MQKLVAENSNNKKIGGNGFNVNIVALGSYLSETGRKFSELTTKESESIYLSLYLTCQENPEMPAIDAAVLSGKHIRSQSTETLTAPTVDAPPTITASEISAGISKNKTELEQEKWWESNMSGKTYQLTGKVTEVEKGTFSGYWVDVDIGRSILVRCGMSSKWTDQVSKIKKGQTFTCVGEVANTWTSFLKTMFQVDAG
ncbi:hypothetical protein [Ochrobactrum chromiisoli]|uniref:Uncharacterized protein n=1 Tax=Ochrobactrum chromiisoli TaxID=2993941 RepID=A0ABT3QLB6_9HYPH|nr:hypothetical protein [Ochrobactrum chromiisoli]MCX2696404.1 hypothetical protein [Ochrobactrum chromiisoli]